MTRDPKVPGISGFTLDSIILAPGLALEALEAYERNRMQHNRRVTDLLEANNFYVNEARAERARNAALLKELEVLRAGLRAVH